MTNEEFTNAVKQLFLRKGYTHIKVYKKCFHKTADVYAKHPSAGKIHYICSLVQRHGKATLEVKQVGVDMVAWVDQMEMYDAIFDDK